MKILLMAYAVFLIGVKAHAQKDERTTEIRFGAGIGYSPETNLSIPFELAYKWKDLYIAVNYHTKGNYPFGGARIAYLGLPILSPYVGFSKQFWLEGTYSGKAVPSKAKLNYGVMYSTNINDDLNLQFNAGMNGNSPLFSVIFLKRFEL